MRKRAKRVMEAGGRVRSFINDNLADFSAIAIVAAILGVLSGAVDEMAALGAEKVTRSEESLGATYERGDLRMLLRAALREISDDWKRMYKRLGDDPFKFRLTYGSDELLISTARSFHELAAPLRSDFTALGYPSDFLAGLQTLIGNFENSINESDAARRLRVGTNAAFIEPARAITGAIEDLEPIVKRVYKTNPRKLAEWLSASHIEHPAQDAEEETAQV